MQLAASLKEELKSYQIWHMQVSEECVMMCKKGWKKNNGGISFRLQYVLSLIYKSSAETIQKIDVKE